MKKIPVCKCGSPRVYRDASVNVNTGEVSEFDQRSCADCSYDGLDGFREVEVDDDFDVETGKVAA